MVCQPGSPCYSLAGKVITGRSVPGYDVINNPEVIGGNPSKSNLIAYNGAYKVIEPTGGNVSLVQYGTSPPKQLAFDWGSFVAGGIVAFIFGYFVFTSSGRQIGYAAGQRVARRIR